MQRVVSPTVFGDGQGFVATLRANLVANVKRLIHLRGFTQRSFAKKMEVDESIVSKWLRQKHFPEDRYIDRMAEILGVSYEELVKTPGDEPNKSAVSNRDLDVIINDIAKMRGWRIIKEK